MTEDRISDQSANAQSFEVGRATELENLKAELQKIRESEEDLRRELFESRENVKAWENLYDLLLEEKKDTSEIIKAHESLTNLIKIEKKETKHAIEALKEHQKISQTEIQQKSATLKNILQINKDITALPNGYILLDKIVESILHVLNAERGILFLKKDSMMIPETLLNITKDEIESEDFKKNFNTINDSINQKKTKIRVFNDYDFSESVEYALIICSPLMIQGKVVGVIYLDSYTFRASLEELDIDTVEIFSSQLALAIESSALYDQLELEFKNKTKELNLANEKLNNIIRNIKSDMNLAKKIQQKLLPAVGEQFAGLICDVVYTPMLEIGGDIYDIFELREGYVRVFLADATGHGIQAALTTTLIKAEYDKIRKSSAKPAEILKQLNNNFLKMYKSLNVFFSCIICDFNLNLKEIIFSSAGHPDQILITNGKLSLLPRTGRIIGIREDVEYLNQVYEFSPASKIFFFTDGVFEEFDKNMDMFGEEKLFEIIDEMKEKSVAMIARKCMSELKKFLEFENRFHDDITLIGFESLP
ncbi:MAG: SpoIIE family protein phosphatase [Leptospira sp.]|nr:SpoIIE family protein phosphatase [Leptospira sp.]